MADLDTIGPNSGILYFAQFQSGAFNGVFDFVDGDFFGFSGGITGNRQITLTANVAAGTPEFFVKEIGFFLEKSQWQRWLNSALAIDQIDQVIMDDAV